MHQSKSRAPRHLAAHLGGVSLLALCALAGTAQAADAPAVENTAVTEVVVTASRRLEKAMDVPVAVTSLSGTKLDVINSSGLDIRVLASRTPSLNVESSFGRTFPRFYIRGLGNTDFDPNAAQPVSVVYDDVALENPMLKSFPIFDLANVEVLRGPQGTLFGRNTPSGVVKLSSAKPSEVFGGYYSVAAGNLGTVNAEGAVTGALGGNWSGRLSGIIQRRNDWVENLYDGEKLEGYEDRAVRGQLLYKGNKLEALISAHARYLDGTPRLFRASAIKPGTNEFNDGFDIEKVMLDGPIISQKLKARGANLKLSYTFEGLGTLHSITAYEWAETESSGDIDGGVSTIVAPTLYGTFFPVGTGGTTTPEEWSQELRFETEQFGQWRGQVGLYYFDQTLKYNELDYINNGDVRHKNYGSSFAVFGSAEYKATDALTLRAGLRYTSDKKKDLVWGRAVFPGVTLPVSTKVDGDNVSGDISATYVITPNLNWYARLATGYLAPAIQDRVNFGGAPTTAGEQTTTSGETGFKGVAFDRKVRFDIGAYYFKTKDLQITAVGGAVNTAKLINAEEAVGYGLETDVSVRPTDNLMLTASASYNHTEIQDAVTAVATCGSGLCTPLDRTYVSGGTRYAYIDGNPLPQAPEWVANVTAQYVWPQPSGAKFFVYGDVAYRSEINFFLYEATEFTGKAFVQTGLRGGYVTKDGMEIAAYVRNLGDEIVSESGIDFNNLTVMVSEPRTFGIGIKKSF
ncbi:TonB-dependent receptor [Asticcacaulis sp. AND118]|uniref:TonB-dependent receptor n=1 Tax=Asticcacaulis sp. AND118 TaxID=2840468 RepID=UPI001D00079A|nr:TonB-dependent receptor [Asticcacaulis sp. AND118]UDF04580.1 TonB-dependent receptor [Asticcacaulis sp. AND118]